jgi:hypothetical protein
MLFRRAIVWDVKKGRKHAELGWETPSGIKYMFKRVKFACVEGDMKRYKGNVIILSSNSIKENVYLLLSSSRNLLA